jgi:hypothetical protein
MALSTAKTKVTSQYRLLRADEKECHDQCLEMIAMAGETTQFGCLYLIDADGDTKIGITQQDRVNRRVRNLQTGNLQRLRL